MARRRYGRVATAVKTISSGATEEQFVQGCMSPRRRHATCRAARPWLRSPRRSAGAALGALRRAAAGHALAYARRLEAERVAYVHERERPVRVVALEPVLRLGEQALAASVLGRLVLEENGERVLQDGAHEAPLAGRRPIAALGEELRRHHQIEREGEMDRRAASAAGRGRQRRRGGVGGLGCGAGHGGGSEQRACRTGNAAPAVTARSTRRAA